MEVVYLFCESDYVRIPLFDGDRRLFEKLSASGGGNWNGARREFLFRRGAGNNRLIETLKGIPSVWIDETHTPPRVVHFINRSREENGPPRFAYRNEFDGCWENKLEAEMRSRKYSLSTIRSYVYFNRQLCDFLHKKPEAINPDDITLFLASVEKDRNYSASSLNLAISGIKFFYRHVMKKADLSRQHRPRHDKNLPMVLDKSEIAKILRLEENPKHRLLLMLAYSSGLRVSEVVVLKKEHIDLGRKVIYVRQGKGRKDRCTLLSERAAEYLKEYFGQNEIGTWLFPGQKTDGPLSIRSAQYIFKKAVRRAGIDKRLSIHSLRHTFATHLLESGTDIRYIQTLLGHVSIRTTERYTHIARQSVLNIRSPLDSI